MPPVYSMLSFERGQNGMDRNALIRHYFEGGYNNKEIIMILAQQHGFTIHIRELKRQMAALQLCRRRAPDIADVVRCVQAEISGSGSALGCRSMQARLRSEHGIIAGRHTVMDTLSILDPDGVASRRRHVLRRRVYQNKGPHFLVHMDGFDKLKPFGFPIHGAICGFSRRILWLCVLKSNNNPKFVAQLYIDYVREIRGVPRCIRSDNGTENTVVADIQRAFRSTHEDDMAGQKSFLTGKSTLNQRIERWWRSAIDHGLGFWIATFKDLVDSGDMDPSNENHM